MILYRDYLMTGFATETEHTYCEEDHPLQHSDLYPFIEWQQITSILERYV